MKCSGEFSLCPPGYPPKILMPGVHLLISSYINCVFMLVPGNISSAPATSLSPSRIRHTSRPILISLPFTPSSRKTCMAEFSNRRALIRIPSSIRRPSMISPADMVPTTVHEGNRALISLQIDTSVFSFGKALYRWNSSPVHVLLPYSPAISSNYTANDLLSE